MTTLMLLAPVPHNMITLFIQQQQQQSYLVFLLCSLSEAGRQGLTLRETAVIVVRSSFALLASSIFLSLDASTTAASSGWATGSFLDL